MKRAMRKLKLGSLVAPVLFAAMVAASPAGAEKAHKYTVGVFLPTTMTDGQLRFEFAEKLAADLSQGLGQPVIGRSFGRYEDFAKAAADGTLDLAVVDAWAAAESAGKYEPVALGSINGEPYLRWALIGRSRAPVKDFRGKKLAITRGVGSMDAKFVTNVIFGGDLDAQHHFKIVAVPSVESALKMVEVKSADAALVPAINAPRDAPVLFRSNKVPAVAVLAIRAKPAELPAALKALKSEGPFDRFVEASPDDVSSLHKLIASGPPKRQPMLADSPTTRLDPAAVVNVHDVGMTYPSFIESMTVANETPDD